MNLCPAEVTTSTLQTDRLTAGDAAGPVDTPVIRDVFLVQHYFTVNFSHENQKALELRTEDAKDRDEWVAAIAHARYVSPRPTVQAEETERKPQEEGVWQSRRDRGLEA